MARFKDDGHYYNLRDPNDLQQLRDEIERRMIARLIFATLRKRLNFLSVEGGHVVSSKTLSLELQGPGLQPMVLVDLPGIIQVTTTDKLRSTLSSITPKECQKPQKEPFCRCANLISIIRMPSYCAYRLLD